MKIMKIINSIVDFFSKAFSNKYIKFTMAIILLILIVLLFRTCNRLKEEKLNHERDVAMYENNLVAMKDTLRTYYDKELDRMVTEKTSYLIKSVDEMQKYNENFYNEFKNMKGMVAGIQSDVSVIVPTLISELSTIFVDPNDSNKYTIPWNFNYRDEGFTQSLYGKTQFRINPVTCKASPLASTLDTNYFNISIRYAFTEENNKYVVKAFSPSKLVKFTELEGALMIDKVVPPATTQNRWAFGPYAGFGLNTNIKGEDSRFGWSIGLSATYNIFAKTSGKKQIKKLSK